MNIRRIMYRSLSCFLALALIVSDVSLHAQGVARLPALGARIGLSQAFVPPLLKGIKVYQDDPFKFDFIVDKGDAPATEEQIKADSTRLIKYFLASLAVPQDDLWVNLSPYEKDRVVPEALGRTDMGRDLLLQDYLLKQVTASLMDPDGDLGRAFWGKVYARAHERFGTIDIPVDTFNKVWIMPERALVYQNAAQAVVLESRLKLMLDADHLAADVEKERVRKAAPALMIPQDAIGISVMREVIIPVLEEEVNTGRTFAPLRQIYHSLILAHWYRDHFKEAALSKVYADKNKIDGIDIRDKDAAARIWTRYVESARTGVYDFIREEEDPLTQEIMARRYFSGGFLCDKAALDKAVDVTDAAAAGRDFAALKRPWIKFTTLLSTENVTDLIDLKVDEAMPFDFDKPGALLESGLLSAERVIEALGISEVLVRQATGEAMQPLVSFEKDFEDGWRRVSIGFNLNGKKEIIFFSFVIQRDNSITDIDMILNSNHNKDRVLVAEDYDLTGRGLSLKLWRALHVLAPPGTRMKMWLAMENKTLAFFENPGNFRSVGERVFLKVPYNRAWLSRVPFLSLAWRRADEVEIVDDLVAPEDIRRGQMRLRDFLEYHTWTGSSYRRNGIGQTELVLRSDGDTRSEIARGMDALRVWTDSPRISWTTRIYLEAVNLADPEPDADVLGEMDDESSMIKGGVDLRARSMKVDVQGPDAAVFLPQGAVPAHLEDAGRLAPIVISATPITDMPAYLGLK